MENLAYVMGKDEFIETGMIVSRPMFEGLRPDEKLHRKCVSILCYTGNKYIQVLNPKGFMLDSHIYVTLDLAEDVLWEKVSYKL